MRAVGLLRDLNTRPISTVAQLHTVTGIPKPTIVRLLATLVEAGLVSKDPRQGGYRITASVNSLSSGYFGTPMVMDAASEAADDITGMLRWPASIGVLDRDAVVVRYSTAADSPFAPFKSTVGMRLSLATRALGRAILAHSYELEKQRIIAMLRNSSKDEDRFARNCDYLNGVLESVRRSGLALRCKTVKPETSTLAVPLLSDGGVQGALAVTYYSSALESAEARRRFVPELERARSRIESRLSDLRRQALRQGGDQPT